LTVHSCISFAAHNAVSPANERLAMEIDDESI